MLATALATMSAACTDFIGKSESSPPAVGTSQQAYCLTYAIINVVVFPGTYHWEGPVHLLNSAEGFGPQTLGLAVSASLAATSTSSAAYIPEDFEISTAVGYDVSKEVVIEASTSVLVPSGGYRRAEAYATYTKTTWDLLGSNCVGPDVLTIAAGALFKPVGIYFRMCTALDCSAGAGQVEGAPPTSDPVGTSTSSGVGGAGGV